MLTISIGATSSVLSPHSEGITEEKPANLRPYLQQGEASKKDANSGAMHISSNCLRSALQCVEMKTFTKANAH